MQRLRTITAIIFFAGLLGMVAIPIVDAFQQARRAAAKSTAFSLVSALNQHPPAVNCGERWVRQDDQELGRMEAKHSVDHSGVKRVANDLLIDPWGTPFHWACRKIDKNTLQFCVWSAGADRHSGTPDDFGGVTEKDGVYDMNQVRESLIKDDVGD